jgi:hypothetical protein
MRKTAWSNLSLVGCRINCLVDYKEWHEGTVMQFHKSGKHHVDFRMANEKRWLCMSRIAFYILERPEEEDVEFKDGDEGCSPVEERVRMHWGRLLNTAALLPVPPFPLHPYPS